VQQVQTTLPLIHSSPTVILCIMETLNCVINVYLYLFCYSFNENRLLPWTALIDCCLSRRCILLLQRGVAFK